MRRLCVLFALALGACSLNPQVEEAAENVVNLKSGTMTELRARRGRGPFWTYDRPPLEMVEILEEAARKARGMGGRPVSAVWAKPHRGEVYAKERTPGEATDDGYQAEFRSAMIAFVHPVPGRPGASQVEIHSLHRGPFHQGAVWWRRDMPRWIDEVMARKIRPIP